MSIRARLRSLRRPLSAVTAVALVGAGLLAAASPASAAPETVTSGTASWGVKSSFRNYVVNGPAAGSITPSGGASQAASNGVFTFIGGTGVVDTAAGTADIDFTGSVRFLGHGGDLDLTFTNPRLVATAGGAGTIYVDYTGKTYPAGTPIGGTDVALATLAGVTLTPSGSTVAVTSASATLTAAGAPAFGGFYAAGEVLDPISASISVLVPATATTTTLSASPASPQLAGTSVTLTATVSPSGAAGTVQFLDGGVDLGAPATVSGGIASLTTTALSASAHTLTAQFVPTDSATFLGSTSTAVAYTITAPPSAVTPTIGTVTGTSVQTIATDAATSQPAKAGNAVTFSATVSDSAAGTVQFLDGGTALGAPAAVTGGVASITLSTLAVGPHSITAAFTPADPAAFTPATSAAAFAYRVASGAAPTACTADASGIAISGGTASWPLSVYTRSAPWVPSATGNITSGATAFELTGGTGFADVDCTVLNFTGSFVVTNASQGGIAITFANPTIIIGANGAGSMTADVSVHVNALGQNPAVDTGPTRATVATFTGATVAPTAGAVEFTVTPDYQASVTAGSWASSTDYSSAFPGSFLFAMPSSVRAFFYQTGVTQSQLNKAAAPLTVGYPYPIVPTSTALVAAPAKPALVGAPVTLTATVTASSGSPVGSVSFLDGATVLGTVPVDAGVAALTVSSLTVGGHQLSATFNGQAPYTISSSAAAHYGIADPTAPASCVVNAATALPVTGGTFSWKVSNTVWAYPDKSASGNASVGAETFTVTAGEGLTDGLCTVVDYTGSFTAVNTNQGAFGFTFTDPTVSVAFDGSGTVVAGVSWTNVPGAASAPPVRVVVASFDGAATAPVDNAVAFTVAGDYVDSVALGTWSSNQDDAFPNQFLLALPSSVRAFFYASGSGGDVNKAAGSVTAGWTIPTYAPQVSPSLGSVEQGQSITFTGTGFAPNEPISGVVNSDPVSLGSVVASADGVVAFSWSVPADFALGVHSVVLAGANSGSTASATFEVVAPPVACVARTVSGATLTWGVKSSFVSYVTGSIANGSFSTSGVTGQFTWSGGTGTANPASALAVVAYKGSVSFTGHGGLLALTVTNPQIQITGPTSALLLLDVTSKSLESGVTTSRNGVAFATLALGAGSNNSTADRIAYGGVPATLTPGGATVFAGFYGAGTALDPVSFALPLGDEVACTSAVDPQSSANLASTGASVTSKGILALLVLTLGAGLVLVARRRTV